MPSVLHEVLAYALPRLRRSRELDDVAAERARIERWHAHQDRSLPTRMVPFLDRRYEVEVEDTAGFPSHVLTRRGRAARRTVVYVHGGGYVAPLDPAHVRYAARLASALDARVVLPDYPLAPEHTWRDSFDAMVELVARWGTGRGSVLAGDSAGGGYALAVAVALRDRGLPQPEKLLLHAPWADLTTSTPETEAWSARDPWLFIGKLRAYADWWAGSPEDLGRPEVSPALADLAGLPPALVFCGTRDTLLPGCRLLARRGAEAGWDLTYVEEPDLLHVYPLFGVVPEARRAWRTTVEFLR